MHTRTLFLALLIAIAGAGRVDSATLRSDDARSPAVFQGVSAGERAGIAIAGAGGLAGLVRLTVIDSATARFVTVTRRACSGDCVPIDSASGTLSRDDLADVFAVIQSEQIFELRDDYAVCGRCPDEAYFTTTVNANGQHKAITSDRETTPEILGRVYVAVAEAIRAARGAP